VKKNRPAWVSFTVFSKKYGKTAPFFGRNELAEIRIGDILLR
jgi:hypothetical protein